MKNMIEKNGALAVSIPDVNDLQHKTTKEAFTTIGAFASALGPAGTADIVLEIETEVTLASKNNIWAWVSNQGWKAVVCWDKMADELVRQSNPFLPLYVKYSYGGGAVNRPLLLAATTGCEVLFRIDPGCDAPGNVSDALNHAAGLIRNGSAAVVSYQYSGRLGARTDFISPGKRSDYLAFLHGFTSIPVLNQITGGALFTIAVNGPPALQFNGVLVWGSDDAAYQLLPNVTCDVSSFTNVPRANSGFNMNLTEYLTRVASMVVLNRLMKHTPLPEAVRLGHAFLELVCLFIDPSLLDLYNLAQAEALLSSRSAAIQAGYDDYKKLRDNWAAILAQVRNTPGLLAHCTIP
jgi:hypothetical protein